MVSLINNKEKYLNDNEYYSDIFNKVKQFNEMINEVKEYVLLKELEYFECMNIG